MLVCAVCYCYSDTLLYRDTQEWFVETKDENVEILGREKRSIFFWIDTQAYIEIRYFNEENKKWESNLFKTNLDNYGNRLSNANYDIEYNDEYIKISLIDYRGKISEVYRFYYEDLEKIKKVDYL